MAYKRRYRKYDDDYDDDYDDFFDDVYDDFFDSTSTSRGYSSGLFKEIIKPIVDTIKPQVKGFVGEFTVSLFLSMLDKNKYKCTNDVIIRVDNRTAQIDHIVVSNYGVFVIETKNYKGIIFGDDHSQYWTQVLYSRKEKMYNPIKQNNGHIRALKDQLSDFSDVPFYSIIVFSPEAELRIKASAHIVYPMDLLEIIKSYKTEVLSDTVREQIYARLCWFKIDNKDLVQNHTDSIRKNKDEQEHKLRNGICPLCGGNLKQRKGQYGSFKGCSNYPKCKFTLKG